MVVELYDTERSYVEALQILVNVSILIDLMNKRKKRSNIHSYFFTVSFFILPSLNWTLHF